ncbi:tRNA (guanosine(46)-N7)-methyltransferase TrmB [Algiphilus sp.]|uniref:tRNA (guanosine(46)-N7)-methyltransferase TrmB n=1 Tax=Algiphilus sp. TaxID=1872431 RepID=UPI003B522D9D
MTTATGDTMERPDAVAPLRRVRSFVRREGRMTPAQADALERLWPRYGVKLSDAGQVQARFVQPAPLTLEIGFGSGEATLWRAQQDPARNVLGIEVHRPGVGGLMLRAAQAGIDNLRVACTDAVEFIEAMPSASIETAIIEFPDPWPKKRHHKRRLVQPAFVATLVERIAPGGNLLLATDWADYAEHMLEVLEAVPALRNAAPAGRGYAPRSAMRPPTRFEERGLRRGHSVFDLAYRRV